MADNPQPGGTLTDADVREVLRNVFDPELQINIIDLGLVYEVRVENGGAKVGVDMTLTSPGCPYGPVLVADVKDVLLQIRGVKEAEVRVVWTPPWTADRISEEAKMELGL